MSTDITNASEIDSGTATGKTLKPGLRADIMRKAMETKDTLRTKGALYVGTGNKKTINVGINTVEIYETAALSPTDADKGKVLGFTSEGELKYHDNLKINADGAAVYNKLQVYATSEASTPTITLNGNDGTVSTTGDITSEGTVQAQIFNAISDRRLKENVEDYRCDASILDLPIKKFDFIDGPKGQIGCIAQDLQKICPEIVHEGVDGYLSISESKIVYLLIQEVKELRKELDELKGAK